MIKQQLDTTGKVIPRKFDAVELQQIKGLKQFYELAIDAKSWNRLRDEAKSKWSEKIVSAVDGLRKWAIKYDKPSKTVTYLGVFF